MNQIYQNYQTPPVLRRQVAITYGINRIPVYTDLEFEFDDNPVIYRSQLVVRFSPGSRLEVVLLELLSLYQSGDLFSDSDSEYEYDVDGVLDF
jgi:hypothetical protein